jgi:hypothetical protein
VAGARKAIHLAADRDHLYFYGRAVGWKVGLFKLAKAGGSPIRLASDVHSNMDFALSESAVYFFQETRSTYAGQITVYALRRVSKAGGNVETIDAGEIPSGKLSVRGDHVVFTDINSVFHHAVARAGLTGPQCRESTCGGQPILAASWVALCDGDDEFNGG